MSCSQKQAGDHFHGRERARSLIFGKLVPTSLVNVDVKIMLKVNATRIKNVLPDANHYYQTRYVTNCFIGETIRSIFDVMVFTVKENIPELMTFIEFHKAFDSIEWDSF